MQLKIVTCTDICYLNVKLTQIEVSGFIFFVSIKQELQVLQREHSGRVLDSRPMGHRFELHRHHCVVSLSKTRLSLLSTGSTQEDPS